MKKRFYLVFILILFSINYIFSQNKITLILQSTFGISIYDNGEYIFSPSGKRLVSYLEWKASPLFQIGLNAEVMYKNFEVEFEGQIGIPNECGQMLDSDWISSGVKTTYSIHSNNSVKNYEFYSAIGYRIPIKKFDITPRFLFYYSDDSFYAHDGYGWYGGYAYSKNGKDNSWDSDYARKAKKLYPIDITTKAYNNFLGFRISFLPINQIKISAETYVSLFSKVQSYDCHHAAPDSKNDFSMTEIQEAKYRRFRETVSFTFILKNKYFIDLTSTYIFGGIIHGELYDDEELVTQKSGNDIYRLNINLGIGLKL